MILRISLNSQVPRPRQVERYATDILEALMPRCNSEKFLRIIVKSTLEQADAFGLTLGNRNFVEIELAKFNFGVTNTVDSMMSTLAHELVHARQFYTGQTHATAKFWRESGIKIPSHAGYYSHREVEARRLQHMLYNTYWLDK